MNQVLSFPRLLSTEARIAVALQRGNSARLAEEVLAHHRAAALDAKAIDRLSALAAGALVSLTDATMVRRCAHHFLGGARHG